MTPTNKFWRIWFEGILPVIIFPAITAVAFPAMFGGLFKSGAAAKIGTLCNPSLSNAPYRLDYTGIGAVDVKLCTLVTFFQAALNEPSSTPFVADFIASLTTLVAIPYIEAGRNGRHFTLAFPVCVGVMYQLYSIAVILPLYWLLFVVTGTASLHRRPDQPHSTVNKGSAESILFSLGAAFAIPSIAMFVLKVPYVTAMWQAFPVWMTAAQFTYRLLRTSSQPGYNTIRATYVILFILSSTHHITVIWPTMGDFASLKRLFLPSLYPLDPLTTSLELATVDFLRWDCALAFTSTAFATFWFARSTQDLLVLVGWYVIATWLLGPGAAIAGVFLWRETILDSRGRPRR